jgi:hypothetical protein
MENTRLNREGCFKSFFQQLRKGLFHFLMQGNAVNSLKSGLNLPLGSSELV